MDQHAGLAWGGGVRACCALVLSAGVGLAAPSGRRPGAAQGGAVEPGARAGTPAGRSSATGAAAGAETTPGVPVAQVSFVETRVEVSRAGGEWQPLAEGERVWTGDRLRTGPESVAQLAFPWMAVALAPSSELALLPGRVLGLKFVSGRVALSSGRDEMVKLATDEVHLRGRGHMVVRRDGGVTRVSVLRGDVQVRAGAVSTRLVEGFGCTAAPRRPCVPRALSPAPSGLQPGADPVYAAVGERFALSWSAAAEGAFHVQVLSFDTDVVLLARDVSGPSVELSVPWPGLYRWRVSARGDDGLEGPPSLEGLVQIMPERWLEEGRK